jgi:hypothetical protein
MNRTKATLITAHAIAFALISCGCLGHMRDKMNARLQFFINKPKEELIAQFGTPQTTMPDGSGGQIWIYSFDRAYTTAGFSEATVTGNANTDGRFHGGMLGRGYNSETQIYGTATTTYRPPKTTHYVARRTFFINKDGIVYRFTWHGF